MPRERPLRDGANHILVFYEENGAAAPKFLSLFLDLNGFSDLPSLYDVNGQIDDKACPLAHLRIGKNEPAGLFDDPIDGRKAKAGPLPDFLGGEEWFEYLGQQLLLDACAGIGDAEGRVIGHRQNIAADLADLG